jgi:hypothetical protein
MVNYVIVAKFPYKGTARSAAREQHRAYIFSNGTAMIPNLIKNYEKNLNINANKLFVMARNIHNVRVQAQASVLQQREIQKARGQYYKNRLGNPLTPQQHVNKINRNKRLNNSHQARINEWRRIRNAAVIAGGRNNFNNHGNVNQYVTKKVIEKIKNAIPFYSSAHNVSRVYKTSGHGNEYYNRAFQEKRARNNSSVNIKNNNRYKSNTNRTVKIYPAVFKLTKRGNAGPANPARAVPRRRSSRRGGAGRVRSASS